MMSQKPKFERGDDIVVSGQTMRVQRDPKWNNERQTFEYLCTTGPVGGIRNLSYHIVYENEIPSFEDLN